MNSAELMRKYSDLIVEAEQSNLRTNPQTAALLNSPEGVLLTTQGYDDEQAVAQLMSKANNKYSPNKAVDHARADAEIKNLQDPLQREKGLADIQNRSNDRAASRIRDTMHSAQMANMDSNQLGQIGQMSSAFQPKNATSNYRGRPGDVQLTAQNRPEITTLPPGTMPAGAKQMRPVKPRTR